MRDYLRSKLKTDEEILLEKMKQRYQEQLKRRRQPSPPQDPRIPKGIEITPLSDWSDSPSYGALAMSIAHYRLIQEEIARGGGASLEDLYLRLCLAIDHQQQPRSRSAGLVTGTVYLLNVGSHLVRMYIRKPMTA